MAQSKRKSEPERAALLVHFAENVGEPVGRGLFFGDAVGTGGGKHQALFARAEFRVGHCVEGFPIARFFARGIDHKRHAEHHFAVSRGQLSGRGGEEGEGLPPGNFASPSKWKSVTVRTNDLRGFLNWKKPFMPMGLSGSKMSPRAFCPITFEPVSFAAGIVCPVALSVVDFRMPLVGLVSM